MIDEIGFRVCGWLFLKNDHISRSHLLDRIRTSRQADKARMKIGRKLFENRRCIPFRVDRDEERLRLRGGRWITFFEKFEPGHEILDVNRATSGQKV